jgi:hypothetical protein
MTESSEENQMSVKEVDILIVTTTLRSYALDVLDSIVEGIPILLVITAIVVFVLLFRKSK